MNDKVSKQLALATAVVAMAYCAAPGSVAAQVVGKVSAVEEKVEVERAGARSVLALGDPIQMGDRIETDASGRVTIAFADGSVATVSSRSQLAVDLFVYDPSKAGGESVLGLLKGKVRAIVSDYYSESGRFDVKTPTATAGVRGTDFVVLYDETNQITDVIGASGKVYVRSLSLASDPGVLITAGEQTSVAQGEAATPPREIDEDRFRYYLRDLEFIGRGRSEGAGFTQPVLSGAAVPEPDRATLGVATDGVDLDKLQGDPAQSAPNASGLAGQPPAALDSGSIGVDF